MTPNLALLPDGSNFNLVIIPEGSENSRDISNIIQGNKGRQLRMVIEKDREEVIKLKSELESLEILGVKRIDHWDTKYFVLDISDKSSFQKDMNVTSWQEFENEYNQKLLNSEVSKEELEVLTNLMVQSFSFKYTQDENGKTQSTKLPEVEEKIISQIEDSLKNLDAKTFMIRDKSGKYLGAYSLVFLPKASEIQLHSVAGMGASVDERIIDMKGKIKIILSALLEEIGSYIYTDYNKLTFTCGRLPVIEMYKKAGFPITENRSGLVVHFN